MLGELWYPRNQVMFDENSWSILLFDDSPWGLKSSISQTVHDHRTYTYIKILYIKTVKLIYLQYIRIPLQNGWVSTLVNSVAPATRSWGSDGRMVDFTFNRSNSWSKRWPAGPPARSGTLTSRSAGSVGGWHSGADAARICVTESAAPRPTRTHVLVMHNVVIRTGGEPSKINDIQNMWNTFLYTFMIWCNIYIYTYICMQ